MSKCHPVVYLLLGSTCPRHAFDPLSYDLSVLT